MEEGKLNTLLLEGMPFVLREVCGIGKKDEAGAAAASRAARGRGRKPPAKRVKKNEEADNEDIDDSESKKLQDLIDAEHEHEKEEKKDLKRLEALIEKISKHNEKNDGQIAKMNRTIEDLRGEVERISGKLEKLKGKIGSSVFSVPPSMAMPQFMPAMLAAAAPSQPLPPQAIPQLYVPAAAGGQGFYFVPTNPATGAARSL